MTRFWIIPGILGFLAGCAPGANTGEETRSLFIDRAVDLGVDFRHQSGASGHLYMPETYGSGVALIDYDGDGDLDIYLVQGGWLDQASAVEDRLFRNDLSEDGSWRFVDVTEESGLSATSYGQGVAIGDVNNDGLLDVFLANLGPDELWVNRGDGTFMDETRVSGLGDDGWATSAVFFDFDRDGWQDLFVTRYLVWSVAGHKECRFQTGLLDYCKPASYSPTVDVLYRNLGEGRFESFDSPEIGSLRTNGLGVVAADLNEDGWLDLFVANDQLPNALWLNDGGTRFHEDALLAGVAINNEGMAEASMGIVAEDLDHDGRADLFTTHLDGETNTFYKSRGDGLFDDETMTAGLATPSLPRTAFGVGALDYDNDSWLDLVMTTGAVHVDIEQQRTGEPLPLKQADQFYRNEMGRFAEISGEVGSDFSIPSVGRGLAIGDLDNDGDSDVVINNAHDRPRILINLVGQDHGWMGLALREESGMVAAEGTSVSLIGNDGSRRVRWVRRGSSYLSAHDDRVRFGLAGAGGRTGVQVDWPRNGSTRWVGVSPGSYLNLVPGLENRP